MKTLIIRNIDDLDKIVTTFYSSLNVELKPISKEENVYWKKKLEKHYLECGCKMGRIFLFITLLGVIAFTIINWAYVKNLGWKYYALLIGVVIIGALVGKLLGKLIARFRLRGDVSRLKGILDSADTQ